jgi:hypothetical protein
MDGTANNHIAGSLGIGTTSFVFGGGTYNLNLTKNITGTVVAGAMNIGSIVNSDVTSAAIGLNVQVTTAAAAFTLNQLRHISVNQTTLGAGSSVSNQYGVYVDQITNGSSNFGFFGNIPAGTNRWNIYMDGSANNYMAGSLGIGSTLLTGYNLRITKNLTGATSTHSVMVDGAIQTDSTNYGAGFRSSVSLAASATTTSLIHYLVIQGSFGASSSATNQMGYWVENLTGATNNYGFYGNIVAGANRWNLYMNGTANNHLGGSLGIGTTSLTGINLRISKTITGATTAYGILQQGIVQSDVTTTAFGYYNEIGTQAAAFTLTNYRHFFATASTIGAGSAVTNQVGFFASATLTGGTNNYGFQGSIPAGTNRWNIYMDGTAANYLAGVLNIGTTTLSGFTLDVNGTARVTGNVGIGTTSINARLESALSTSNGVSVSLRITNSSAASASPGQGVQMDFVNDNGFNASVSSSAIRSITTSTANGGADLLFLNYNGSALTEYMRISRLGSVGIGTTSLTGFNLSVAKNITGGSTSYGISSSGAVQSDVTGQANYFISSASTAATTFTLPNLYHYRTFQGTFGAGSTVTNQFGYLADSSLTGATNNYGFYGNIPSGTNRWNLYMAGTAANFLSGVLNIGTTTLSGYKLDVNGTARFAGNSVFFQNTAGAAGTGYAMEFATNSLIPRVDFVVNGAYVGQFSALGTDMRFVNTTTGNLLFITSANQERARITSGGSFGIGTGSSINASAKVQVDSTTQGFLPPRMTAAQRAAIASPATGLIVYQTDGTEGVYVYSGGTWKSLTMV